MPEISNEEVDAFLEHHGIKGMKWGVHRSRQPEKVRVTTKRGARVKAKGGTGQKPSDDAIKVAIAKQKARKSSTDALSNKELKLLVERMNMEQQYSKLTAKPSRVKTGHDKVKSILSAGQTVNSAIAFATSPAGRAIASQLKVNINT